MAFLTSFFTGLLSDILRPLIREEFAKAKLHIIDAVERKRSYEKYDREAEELIKQMAEASTSEERYAILGRIKNARASLNS
jgi:hypothetical protein